MSRSRQRPKEHEWVILYQTRLKEPTQIIRTENESNIEILVEDLREKGLEVLGVYKKIAKRFYSPKHTAL